MEEIYDYWRSAYAVQDRIIFICHEDKFYTFERNAKQVATILLDAVGEQRAHELSEVTKAMVIENKSMRDVVSLTFTEDAILEVMRVLVGAGVQALVVGATDKLQLWQE